MRKQVIAILSITLITLSVLNVKADTVRYYDRIAKNTIIGWKIEDLTVNVNAEPPTLGNKILNILDIIKMKFNSTIPTDASELYSEEPPNFIEIYVNDVLIPWNDIKDEGFIFQFLIFPLEYDFGNGTILTLSDTINLILSLSSDAIINYTLDSSDSVFYDLEIDSYPITHMGFKIYKTTAISYMISVYSSDWGSMTLRYDDDSSNIDISGQGGIATLSETRESGNQNTVVIPGFTLIAITVTFSTLYALYKRKK